MAFRILHLDTGREMRGGQWQVLRLVAGLSNSGCHSTLLARDGAPLLAAARAQGLDARPLALRELLKLASSHDLIHAHDARAHSLAALLKRPFVVARRVAFPIRPSFVSRWKYARPARYIAVSRYVREILSNAGIAEEKIDVVYDGVVLPACQQFSGRTKVVALDSDDPGKCRPLIELAAARARIEVFFSKNLEQDLSGAALFVYITDLEGLGSAALLAMAAGVPVLASAVGGLPEIVSDGVTGLLTGNAPEQIADGMLRVLDDRSLLERLGRNARARVEESFTTEHMVRSTLQVYGKVLT